MNADRFDATVRKAARSLPEWVREALNDVDIVILDEADESLDPDGTGLLGLYCGTPLTEREANHAGQLPDVIFLFRNPHLALPLSEKELHAEIARTLMHEVAHYFGYDDDYLEAHGWD